MLPLQPQLLLLLRAASCTSQGDVTSEARVYSEELGGWLLIGTVVVLQAAYAQKAMLVHPAANRHVRLEPEALSSSVMWSVVYILTSARRFLQPAHCLKQLVTYNSHLSLQ